MSKQLLILGAGGHGKVVADIAKNCGYEDITFLDDNKTETRWVGCPVVGGTADMACYPDHDLIVAVGDGAARQRLTEQAENLGMKFPVLIHPKAVVAEDVSLGAGTVVMAGAVINPGAVLGKGCIVNTCASVDHDCVLDDFVHVSVGAHVAGTVTVGSGTWIGVGAAVINNISICRDCMIGAGAVVVKPITESGVYMGVPARKKQ